MVHKKLPRHLIYGDDILIFLQATRANGRCIKSLLDHYGQLSGQKFSPPKSSVLYSPTVPSDITRYIKDHNDMATETFPFKYLGVPIFKGAPKVEYLSPIADAVIQIFSRWRGHSLSLAGRHYLINSVIASSLVHSIMIYRWPRSLLHCMEVAT